ncbi:MAG: acetyl-CoA carboxylase, biotin carboxyl carrier protein [Phycisphaerae bacterium]
MIDVQRVRELAEVMAEHDLTEIRFREGETVLTLRKGPAEGAVVWPGPVMQAPPAAPAPAAAAPAPVTAEAQTADEGLVPVLSPMVGTFYGSPDPESPPFVTVGSEIEVNTPVCIIEAMKVFNEIKSEVAGRVERVLVKNEQAVEYGQPLMMVRPRA